MKIKNKCLVCLTDFIDFKVCKRKFCGRICYAKYRSIFYRNINNSSWKNNNDMKYSGFHMWLYREFGSAKLCENREKNFLLFTCKLKSNNFQWALIKGKKYEKNRDNYFQLCRQCHAKYDIKPDTSKKISIKNKGKGAWNTGIRGYLVGPTMGKKKYSESYLKKKPHLRTI